MTKESLEAYRSKKEEIKELQQKLLNIADGKPMIGNDTILDYRKGYPIPEPVVGVDWEKVRRTEKRYKQKIDTLLQECEEVEEYIEEIPDSLMRRLIRMYYLDGLSQCEISKRVHMSQSSVSKKISFFLKLE